MRLLEKRGDEIYKDGDWIFVNNYDLNEIGDKINEIIKMLSDNDE